MGTASFSVENTIKMLLGQTSCHESLGSRQICLALGIRSLFLFIMLLSLVGYDLQPESLRILSVSKQRLE